MANVHVSIENEIAVRLVQKEERSSEVSKRWLTGGWIHPETLDVFSSKSTRRDFDYNGISCDWWLKTL